MSLSPFLFPGWLESVLCGMFCPGAPRVSYESGSFASGEFRPVGGILTVSSGSFRSANPAGRSFFGTLADSGHCAAALLHPDEWSRFGPRRNRRAYATQPTAPTPPTVCPERRRSEISSSL